MKASTKLIRILVDFEYGKNKGLGYIAILVQFATFIEVTKIGRVWYFVLIPTGVILTWCWGMFLRKINFRKRETDFINNENPMITGIYKAVKK